MNSIKPALKRQQVSMICPACGEALNFVFVGEVVVAFCGDVNYEKLNSIIDSIDTGSKKDRLIVTCRD